MSRAKLIIFSGESNSGGFALNSQASLAELAPRPETLILNNTTLAGFEPLDVGTNNLVGHSGLSNGSTHGWEIGLANAVAGGQLRPSPLYLVKTGQGGSTIANWNSGGTFYNTFLARINAAKTLLGSQQYNAALWYTQGINDAIAGTSVSVWKAATIAHLEKIRVELPGVPICFSDVTPSYPNYSTAIMEICEEVEDCFFVSAEGASLRDINHWDYAGMKLISSRMVRQTNAFYTKGGFIFF